MTVTVNFEAPQAQLGNGTTGIEISPIIIPYSIHNTDDPLQYLGGQVALTKEDGVAFSDNTTDWYKKALVKVKNMVADAEMYVPDQIIEVPESSAVESPEELPTSSATAGSVASSEATVASSSVEDSASSSEAPASSVAPVNSAVEAPVSSATAVEMSEAPVSSSEPTVNTSVTESPVNSETEAQ